MELTSSCDFNCLLLLHHPHLLCGFNVARTPGIPTATVCMASLEVRQGWE